MKKQSRIKSALTGLALASMGLSLFGPNVIAANPYGIDYSGGAALSSENININPTLISNLKPLVADSNDNEVEFEDGTKWETVYEMVDGECTRSNYKFTGIGRNNTVNQNSGLNYTIKGQDYSIEVRFDKIAIEGYDSSLVQDNQVIALEVHSKSGAIATSIKDIYRDSSCANIVENSVPIHFDSGGHIYFQVNLKLHRRGSTETFAPNGLYFGITDIDAAQSYKILSAGNELSPSNMFARSVESLQPEDTTLRNMYSASGQYIYSQYDTATFNIISGADLFVSVKPAVQRNGLDVVFGFTGGAASGVQYYSEQYTVTYESDENGSISGIDKEQVVSGDVPTGSTSSAKKDYELDYWIADKDVTLENGTIIKAGEKITPEQIKMVIVDQNLTFTAIHKTIEKEEPKSEDEEESSDIRVPDTGSFTGEGSGIAQVTIYILGGLMVIPLGYLIALICRKKIDFNK